MKSYRKYVSLMTLGLLTAVLLVSCGGGGGGGYSTSSPAPAAGPLTTLDVATLKADGYYFNVHTANFPNGEIRGQITVPAGATGTITINTTLSGSNEVPPTTSAGTGTGTLAVNLDTGAVSSASISVSGLSGAVIAAHIHQAAAGVNGAVVVAVSTTTPGTTTTGTGIGY
jgi:CHRD domain-containing protein